MKKNILCIFLTAGFLLTGCNEVKEDANKKDNEPKIENKESDGSGNKEIKNEQSEGETTTFKIEEGTPQSWIDLFTFTNVTIKTDYNLSILSDYEYRCVNGKWYARNSKSTEAFEPHNGRDIFDLYLCNYSKFTYDEEYGSYKAENWRDESEYVRNVVISLDENNRIYHISDTSTSNSSVVACAFEFSKYGETTLD